MAPPGFTREFSWSARDVQDRREEEHLLSAPHTHEHDEEDQHADSDGLYPPHSCWTSDNPSPPNPHAELPVFLTIHRIRRDIIRAIDDPYSVEQLKAPRMNMSVVRPLVDHLYELQDVSIVYCLIVNRMEFMREQSYATHHQTVNLTRALLCELLAEKILRRFNEHNPGPKGLLKMANILVASFDPFQNAPERLAKTNSHLMLSATQKKGLPADRRVTALEIAIISESKSFLASTACQKVVDAIYRGKIVYTPSSFIDIIPDHYKKRPISLYDPRRAPMLNQYRLVVPRTRNWIEVGHFVILLFLYIMVMSKRELRQTVYYSKWELAFNIYSWGWILDQWASVLEHGWGVYTQNLWSFLDVSFSCIYAVYFVLRMHALHLSDSDKALSISRTALDVLSVGAPILVPRLAFNINSENMLFVSLRAMISDFVALTLLAIWCFGGFLLSLKWMHEGTHQPITISKWMIWIWFGLDGTGIEQSPDFHWFLGPSLMILYAFLGNTLFLTILVAMLSNTFSLIVANATAEIQYRRAVLTFMGVKSDAIFAYWPPFNIIALFLMLPLKAMVSERWFHKINVVTVRVLNAPILLLIALYERKTLWVAERYHRHHRAARDQRAAQYKKSDGAMAQQEGGWWTKVVEFWNLERFSVHGNLQAVFDMDLPQSVIEELEEQDDLASQSGQQNGNDLESHFPGLTDRRTRIGSMMTEEMDPGRGNERRKGSQGHSGKSRKNESSSSSSEVDPNDETPAEKHHHHREKSVSKGPLGKMMTLEEEFATSSDEEANEARKVQKNSKQSKRLDSIIDLADVSNAAVVEANERLHKLESCLQRVEHMLLEAAQKPPRPRGGSFDGSRDVRDQNDDEEDYGADGGDDVVPRDDSSDSDPGDDGDPTSSKQLSDEARFEGMR